MFEIKVSINVHHGHTSCQIVCRDFPSALRNIFVSEQAGRKRAHIVRTTENHESAHDAIVRAERRVNTDKIYPVG